MVDFLNILKKEMVPAQGCTEPIAIAYATSIASELLDGEIVGINLSLSGNIIKNALGVGIPGTGQVGIEIAAALGALIKKSDKKLEILSDLNKDTLHEANKLIAEGKVKIKKADTSEKLYIKSTVIKKEGQSEVIIIHEHTNVVSVKVNDKTVYQKAISKTSNIRDEYTGLSVENIYEFATTCPFDDIAFVLDGAKMNKKVSNEGMKNNYGLQVGQKIAGKLHENSVLMSEEIIRILSKTCAASDARMDGCDMPIMTTAGSGNQGIACSMPIIEMAEMVNASDEKLARALVMSNLMVVHIKEYIGRLSPLCGAGIAGASGACCGLTYLQGGKLSQIDCALQNMIATMSGLLCDGAKETCALKIAAGTNAALFNSTLALNNIAPTTKDGIVFKNAEETIEHIQDLVKSGLRDADNTILDLMLSKQEL